MNLFWLLYRRFEISGSYSASKENFSHKHIFNLLTILDSRCMGKRKYVVFIVILTSFAIFFLKIHSTLKVVCDILKNTNCFMMALKNIPVNRAKKKKNRKKLRDRKSFTVKKNSLKLQSSYLRKGKRVTWQIMFSLPQNTGYLKGFYVNGGKQD